MTTITQLRTDRQTAGAAYVSAATAYIDAWVELHAYDLTLKNVAGDYLTSFNDLPPLPVLHSEFLREFAPGSLSDRVRARHEELLASMTP
jgi:hypothetical protein